MNINIPSVNRRERHIGSLFNELFDIINKSESSTEDIVWNFDEATYSNPFFISSLAIYRDASNISPRLVGLSDVVNRYFSVIHFENPKLLNSSLEADEMMERYRNKTYLPICKFSIKRNNFDLDKIESSLQSIIKAQVNYSPQINEVLRYLLSELVGNMQEHSQGNYGYLYSQYLKTQQELYICLADDGRNIYSSYVKAQKYLDQIQDSPAMALKYAIEGFSTKDRAYCENRGYGLSSNIDMIVNGLGGAFFILSGQSFFRLEKEQPKKIVNLPKWIDWNGTIILIRIPIIHPADFNYINYIQ